MGDTEGKYGLEGLVGGKYSERVKVSTTPFIFSIHPDKVLNVFTSLFLTKENRKNAELLFGKILKLCFQSAQW